jgi:hypothetical protein
MAQTTQDASFGPVFIVATFHIPICHVFRRIQAISRIKHKLESKIKKGTYLQAQTTPDASFGPVLVSAAHPNHQ